MPTYKPGDIQGDYRRTQGGNWRNTKTGKLGDPFASGGGTGGGSSGGQYFASNIIDPNQRFSSTPDLINAGYNLNSMQAMNALRFGNANQINPFGTQTTTIDPNTGQPTVTQGLSGANQQAIEGIQGSGIEANKGLRSLLSGGIYGSLVNPSGAGGPAPMSNFEDAVFNRLTYGLNEQKTREGEQLSQTLANRGIPVGSQLYNDQMKQHNDRYDRQFQTAKQQAVESGTNMTSQAAGTLGGIGQTGYIAPNFYGFNPGQYGQVDVNSAFSALEGTNLARDQLAFQRSQAGRRGGGGGGGSAPRVRSPFGQ